MGKSAMSKFVEADTLDKQADRLKKRDPVVSDQIANLAHRKRLAGIKQMRRRPKKKAISTIKL